MRLSERVGGYQVTVFTARRRSAGPVDVSVFVQDADTGEPAAGVDVTVQAAPRGRPDEAVRGPATAEAATNKLFRSAIFDLPESGWWDIRGDGGGGARTRRRCDLKRKPPTVLRAGRRWRRGSAGRPWRSFSSRSIKCWSDGSRGQTP